MQNDMNLAGEIEKAIAACSFTAFGYIDTECLRYHPEVRKICEGNVCRNYSTSWACPPAVGTLEECRARVEQYSTMLLFSKKYDLEDSFDLEGMTNGLVGFKKAVDIFDEKLRKILPAFLLLSNEGCGRCKQCTYPDAPCRFPHLAIPSMEAYGLVVSQVCQDSGLPYYYGPRTITYTACVLVD